VERVTTAHYFAAAAHSGVDVPARDRGGRLQARHAADHRAVQSRLAINPW
jgi:hypothetical protein